MGFFKRNTKADGWMALIVRKDGVCVTHVRRLPLSMPIVEFAVFYPGGEASWGDLLEKAAKDLHTDRYHCTTLLGAGEYHLLSVDAPNVPPDELKTAIRWRLKDMLDFHVDDATIDVLNVPVDKNASVRNHSMYAIAARNQVISQRQALFGEVKIPLSVIDIPEMAQRNFAALLEPEGRGVAMLSFGDEGGLLTLSFAGELYLSRRIDVTLMQLLSASDEQINILFDRITLELQRSLDHFDRQYHFITIAKLILAPLDEKISGLKEYLASHLYVPVETLNLDSIIDTSKVGELKSLQNQQRYFMTLGAALRHEERAL